MALLAGGLGCTAKRVVVPTRLPIHAASAKSFKDVTLVLRELRVSGLSSEDRPDDANALRAPFLTAAQRVNRFAAAVDGRGMETAPEGLVLVLDLDFHASHSSEHTYILDVFFFWPWSGVWPLSPWWGDAKVTAHAYAFGPDGTEVWRTSQSGEAPYSMVVYSWYRTGPIEEALGEAYAQVFERVMHDLAESNAEITAALAAASPPAVAAAGPAAPTGAAAGDSAADGPREKLAVLPTKIEESASGTVPDLFDDYVLSALHQAGSFEVIGKSDLDALIDFEAQKELLGCDEVICFAELGGALGVDLLLSVAVARLGDDWAATAKLVNLREVRVEARANIMIKGEVRELMEAMPQLFEDLLQRRQREADAT